MRVELTEADGEDSVLEIPWAPRSPGRPKREVLEPALDALGAGRRHGLEPAPTGEDWLVVDAVQR